MLIVKPLRKRVKNLENKVQTKTIFQADCQPFGNSENLLLKSRNDDEF